MRPTVALTIAGSDPSGGAGIQADLKTFSALGAYGTAVITALTAQNTRGVTGVSVVDPAFVRQQLDTLVSDVAIDAVKIGMLADAGIAEVVREFLARSERSVVVLDPVMVATSGDRLLDDAAVDRIRELLPYSSIVTPNLPEAAVLLGQPEASDLATMRRQAADLVALGAPRVLLKGGHLPAVDGMVTDVFRDETGDLLLTAPLVDTLNTHGTGCTLSSALAALRPARPDWRSTASEAKSWLSAAIEHGTDLRIGGGRGPVHHFHAIWP